MPEFGFGTRFGLEMLCELDNHNFKEFIKADTNFKRVMNRDCQSKETTRQEQRGRQALLRFSRGHAMCLEEGLRWGIC
jgi:hypothetical protein